MLRLPRGGSQRRIHITMPTARIAGSLSNFQPARRRGTRDTGMSPSTPPRSPLTDYSLEVTLTGTGLSKREVSYLSVHRARLLLNPMSFVGCLSRAWSTTRQLRENERAQIEQEEKDENIDASWVSTTRILLEPFGYQFGYHLLGELKKTWKPPQHIPRGHVRVEGFVELTGNGRACVMDVDLSIDPKTLKSIHWRSGNVRSTRQFRMGPPEDPRGVKRMMAKRQVMRDAAMQFEEEEREKIRAQMKEMQQRKRELEEAQRRQEEEEQAEQLRARESKSEEQVRGLLETAQDAGKALGEKIARTQAQVVEVGESSSESAKAKEDVKNEESTSQRQTESAEEQKGGQGGDKSER